LDKGIKLSYTEASKEDKGNERHKMDTTALEALNLDYCKDFLQLEKLNKLSGTYLEGVAREVVDGFLHVGFNLHLAKTFRSSSSEPNFQNIPIRNPEVAKLIRSAFIPRDGHVLVEIDYAALEFRIASCFWKDPAMVDYASDPKKDIHRDCAAEIFKTKPLEVSKNARYCAKNQFVFPELYGDFYMPCAKANWESIDTLELKVGDVPMRDHLRKQGITKLGLCSTEERPVPNTFEWHLKNVEKTFYEWFPVLKQKRDDFWKQYLKTGQFELMTGFVIQGVNKRNFVLNAIIQGPAFHLLLWSVIQLVKTLKRRKMKSLVIGQIHDSLLVDCPRNELQDVINLAEQTMTKDTRSNFDWIITPLDIEVEASEVNWYEKKVWERRNGEWQPK